jgi:D-alanine-D-alanine ligase
VLAVKPLVAIIAGGDTQECDASVASGYNVFNSLRSRFPCVLLKLLHGEWSVLAHDAGGVLDSTPVVDSALRLLDVATGRRIRPDVGVLCTHGFPGETGELQGLLSISGIPYCSSGVFASALASDKFRCSQYLASVGGTKIPRQRRLTIAQLAAASADDPDMRPPFVLKPTSLGSSLGVLSVHDRRWSSTALGQAAGRRCDYVVEEFIDGTEITAGAVRLRTHEVLLPMASVSRPELSGEPGIRTFTDHKSVQLHIPADIPGEAASRVREEMSGIGELLGLVGFYRADFIWSAGELYFLEVNTIPGLSEKSVFTRLAEAAGFRLGDLLEALILETVDGCGVRGSGPGGGRLS